MSGGPLRERVDRQAVRLTEARKARNTILSQTMFLGTLGLTFVLPVIVGAYVGLWLDRLSKGFSIQWTLTCILLGVAFGSINVYLLIRRK